MVLWTHYDLYQQKTLRAERRLAAELCAFPNSPKNLQQGFGLIEVLVAMIVLSVGLLALTSLQLNSLKTTNEARVSTSVTLLAQEMADRIRTNPAGRASYNGISLTAPTGGGTNTNCEGNAASCSPANLVTYDTNQWISDLIESISPGSTNLVRGSIGIEPGSTPQEFVVSVQWDAARTGSLPATSVCPTTFSTATQVDPEGCYRLRFVP